jgi:hypothetical protein
MMSTAQVTSPASPDTALIAEAISASSLAIRADSSCVPSGLTTQTQWCRLPISIPAQAFSSFSVMRVAPFFPLRFRTGRGAPS